MDDVELMPKTVDREEPEPLITECPGCHTRFRVSEAQLQRARGRVRCGACLTVFNGVERLDWGPNQGFADEQQAQQALDALLDELAADSDGEAAPPSPTEVVPPAATVAIADTEAPAVDSAPDGTSADDTAAVDDIAAADGTAAADDIAAAEDTAAADDASSADGAPAPADTGSAVDAAGREVPAWEVAARAAAATEPALSTALELPAAVVFGEPRRRRPWLWIGAPVAVLLLAAQVLWLRFDEWSTDPFWRGVYAPICNVLGCTLPVQRDITRLGTRQLAVRSHPEQPGALQVTAVIVNEAEFAQPFPVLELRFTTPRGILVAGRRFAPEEYLSGDARGMTRFPSRTPVQIQLSIDDPGPDAVNYVLRFR